MRTQARSGATKLKKGWTQRKELEAPAQPTGAVPAGLMTAPSFQSSSSARQPELDLRPTQRTRIAVPTLRPPPAPPLPPAICTINAAASSQGGNSTGKLWAFGDSSRQHFAERIYPPRAACVMLLSQPWYITVMCV